MPIDGVPIDSFFGREGIVFGMLSRLLAETNGPVTLPVLLDELQQNGMEIKRATLDRWVRRNSGWLATAIGTWFVEGSGGGNPGLFRKADRREIALEGTDFDSLSDAAQAYARAGLAVPPLHHPDDDGKCSCSKGTACGSILVQNTESRTLRRTKLRSLHGGRDGHRPTSASRLALYLAWFS